MNSHFLKWNGIHSSRNAYIYRTRGQMKMNSEQQHKLYVQMTPFAFNNNRWKNMKVFDPFGVWKKLFEAICVHTNGCVCWKWVFNILNPFIHGFRIRWNICILFLHPFFGFVEGGKTIILFFIFLWQTYDDDNHDGVLSVFLQLRQKKKTFSFGLFFF